MKRKTQGGARFSPTLSNPPTPQPTQPLRASWLAFLSHAAIASPACLDPVLRALVAALSPPPPPLPADGAPPPPPPLLWAPLPPAATAAQAAVIDALVSLTRLVPTAPARAAPLLAGAAPHAARGARAQRAWAHASLALAARVPALAPAAVEAVVDAVVARDVEILWQDIAPAADGDTDTAGATQTATPTNPDSGAPAADDADAIFELEGHTDAMHIWDEATAAAAAATGGWGRAGDAGAHGATAGGFEPAAAAAARPAAAPRGEAVAAAADGVDAVMDAALGGVGGIASAWRVVAAAFERAILPARRPKFAPYLVWAVLGGDPVSRAPEFMEGLLDAALGRWRKGGGGAAPPPTRPVPTTVRAGAAAFYGSFAARAATAPRDALVASLARLAAWCVWAAPEPVGVPSALAPLPTATATPDDAAVWPAACQALFYALAFRCADLVPLSSEAGAHTTQPTPPFLNDVATLVSHPTRPLSRVQPPVALEFARAARRVRLPGVDATAAAAAAGAPPPPVAARGCPARADAFFPFDPYLLPRSADRLALDATYIAWAGGRPRWPPGAAPPVAAAVADAAIEPDSPGASVSSLVGSSSGDDDDDDDEGMDEDGDSSSDDDLSTDQLSPPRPWWHRPVGAAIGACRKRPAVGTPSSDGRGGAARAGARARAPLVGSLVSASPSTGAAPPRPPSLPGRALGSGPAGVAALGTSPLVWGRAGVPRAALGVSPAGASPGGLPRPAALAAPMGVSPLGGGGGNGRAWGASPAAASSAESQPAPPPPRTARGGTPRAAWHPDAWPTTTVESEAGGGGGGGGGTAGPLRCASGGLARAIARCVSDHPQPTKEP